MGINESPDRFVSKPAPNLRFPLLAVWDFARSPFGPQSTRACWRTQHNRFESRTGAMDAEGRAAFDCDAKGSDGNDETHDEEDSAGRARSCIVRGACMHHGGMRRWRRRAGANRAAMPPPANRPTNPRRLKSRASPSNHSPMARTIAASSMGKMASGCAYASRTRATSRLTASASPRTLLPATLNRQ